MADGQTYFMILLAISILSNFLFPTTTFLYVPYTYFGLIFISFGLILAFWSRSLFIKNKTTLSPFESPTSLLTSGPFSFSRNPIYLAMASILLGIAVFFGTLFAFVFPFLFLIMIETLLIPVEEKSMKKTFGKQYSDYKNRVRQWI